MKAPQRFGGFCAAGVVLMVTSVGRGQYAGQRPLPPQNPQTNQPTVNPVAAQRKAVLDAQLAVNDARAKIAQTRARVTSAFESRDDWVAAKKAVTAAQAKYDAALKPVMAALQSNADYQKLQVSRKAAQAKLEVLKAAPLSTDPDTQKTQDDQLSAAAGEVLNDGFAMNKMEVDARESDGNLGMAKEELSDAKKAMDALQSQVTTAMQADPEYIAEQQTLTNALQQLTAAKASLASAERPQRSTQPPRTAQPPSRGGGSN